MFTTASHPVSSIKIFVMDFYKMSLAHKDLSNV